MRFGRAEENEKRSFPWNHVSHFLPFSGHQHLLCEHLVQLLKGEVYKETAPLGRLILNGLSAAFV